MRNSIIVASVENQFTRSDVISVIWKYGFRKVYKQLLIAAEITAEMRLWNLRLGSSPLNGEFVPSSALLIGAIRGLNANRTWSFTRSRRGECESASDRCFGASFRPIARDKRLAEAAPTWRRGLRYSPTTWVIVYAIFRQLSAASSSFIDTSVSS